MRKSTHTPEYAQLRRRLTELRAIAGLSQRQLATILRVPHSWIAKVEAGERRIDLIEFAWFSAGCGASPTAEAIKLLDKMDLVSSRKVDSRNRQGGRT